MRRQLPPLRLYSALDHPPCRGVSTFAPGAPPTLCEYHYCAGTIQGRGLLCLSVLMRIVRDLFEGGKKLRKYSIFIGCLFSMGAYDHDMAVNLQN